MHMAWEHKGFTIQMWRLGSSPLSPCSTTLVGMYAMFLHYSSTLSNVFRVYDAKLCMIHTQLFLFRVHCSFLFCIPGEYCHSSGIWMPRILSLSNFRCQALKCPGNSLGTYLLHVPPFHKPSFMLNVHFLLEIFLQQGIKSIA